MSPATAGCREPGGLWRVPLLVRHAGLEPRDPLRRELLAELVGGYMPLGISVAWR
jgi:hypothetical protein